jgi:L-arabinose isomerase
MGNKKNKLKVGFVPVMLGAYDCIDPQIRTMLTNFWEKVVRGLGSDQMEIAAIPVAATHQEISAGCMQLTESGVDLVVVSHLCYAPSGEIAPTLLKNDFPVLLWPAQPMYEIDAAQYDYNMIILNHGLHGTQDLANILRRKGRAFGVMYEHWEKQSFHASLMEWTKAGRAVAAMKRSNPIVLGGRFEGMLDLQLDEETFIDKFGVKGTHFSLDDFSTIAKTITNKQIDERLKYCRSHFGIGDTLNEQLLRQGLRCELALRKVLEAKNSKAVGINFMEVCRHREIADAMHLAASLLMADGFGYGGEGDWTTAMLGYGLGCAGGAVSFSEIFSAGFGDNRLVLKHWGDGNIAMAADKVLLSKSACMTDKGNSEFAVVDFEFKPSKEATLVNLTADEHSNGQLMTIVGSIEEDHLPKCSGPRAIFKPKNPDVRDVLNRYAENGGSHHLVLMPDDSRDIITKVAKLCGWRYIGI